VIYIDTLRFVCGQWTDLGKNGVKSLQALARTPPHTKEEAKHDKNKKDELLIEFGEVKWSISRCCAMLNNISFCVEQIEDLQSECVDACEGCANEDEVSEGFDGVLFQFQDLARLMQAVVANQLVVHLQPIMAKFLTKEWEQDNGAVYEEYLESLAGFLGEIVPGLRDSSLAGILVANVIEYVFQTYCQHMFTTINDDETFRFDQRPNVLCVMDDDMGVFRDFFLEYSDVLPMKLLQKRLMANIHRIKLLLIFAGADEESLDALNEEVKECYQAPIFDFDGCIQLLCLFRSWSSENARIAYLKRNFHINAKRTSRFSLMRRRRNSLSGVGSSAFLIAPDLLEDATRSDWTRIEVCPVSASGIAAADDGVSSDPYCTVRLKVAKSSNSDRKNRQNLKTTDKRKTRTIMKTLNPVWNEGFSFLNKKKQKHEPVLFNFQVWDYDRSWDDFLGQAELTMTDIREAMLKQQGTHDHAEMVQRKPLLVITPTQRTYRSVDMKEACELTLALTTRPGEKDTVTGLLTVQVFLFDD
jgi:hypothetical protein